MGRTGRHEEIAPMIVFSSSSAASYATGGVFVVDGGFTAVRDRADDSRSTIGR